MPSLSFPLAQQLGGNATPPCQQALFFLPQHFLDLFDRIYPVDYIEALKSPGPGYEVLQAYAQVFTRVSLAIARLDCGAHILSSYGPAVVIATLQLARDPSVAASLAFSVTVKKGTVFLASKSGRRFTMQQDQTFAHGDAGPHDVLATAVEPAWEYNLQGTVVTPNGLVLPGEIDTIDTLITDPPFSDISFMVSQRDSTYGGQPGMLDALGHDRGIERNSGEADGPYKARVRRLPDTVSPGAIRRAVTAALAPFGATFDFIETFDPKYQTAYDVTSAMAGLIDTNLFVYDDPRPAYPPFRNRWLGEEDFRAAFIIVVPNLAAINDEGMAYDDTAENVHDLISPSTGGTRAMSAYDVDATMPVPQGFYDGFDLAKQAVYKGLADLLDAIKAAGVNAIIELQGQ